MINNLNENDNKNYQNVSHKNLKKEKVSYFNKEEFINDTINSITSNNSDNLKHKRS